MDEEMKKKFKELFGKEFNEAMFKDMEHIYTNNPMFSQHSIEDALKKFSELHGNPSTHTDPEKMKNKMIMDPHGVFKKSLAAFGEKIMEQAKKSMGMLPGGWAKTRRDVTPVMGNPYYEPIEFAIIREMDVADRDAAIRELRIATGKVNHELIWYGGSTYEPGTLLLMGARTEADALNVIVVALRYSSDTWHVGGFKGLRESYNMTPFFHKFSRKGAP